jgi:hypothetical protein
MEAASLSIYTIFSFFVFESTARIEAWIVVESPEALHLSS